MNINNSNKGEIYCHNMTVENLFDCLKEMKDAGFGDTIITINHQPVLKANGYYNNSYKEAEFDLTYVVPKEDIKSESSYTADYENAIFNGGL